MIVICIFAVWAILAILYTIWAVWNTHCKEEAQPIDPQHRDYEQVLRDKGKWLRDEVQDLFKEQAVLDVYPDGSREKADVLSRIKEHQQDIIMFARSYDDTLCEYTQYAEANDLPINYTKFAHELICKHIEHLYHYCY